MFIKLVVNIHHFWFGLLRWLWLRLKIFFPESHLEIDESPTPLRFQEPNPYIPVQQSEALNKSVCSLFPNCNDENLPIPLIIFRFWLPSLPMASSPENRSGIEMHVGSRHHSLFKINLFPTRNGDQIYNGLTLVMQCAHLPIIKDIE